jgi:hypothetical protein
MTSTPHVPDEHSRLLRLASITLVAIGCARPHVSPIVPRESCAGDTLALGRGPVRDAATSVRVAPGVTYRCLVRAAGPWVVHAVELDLRQGFRIETEHAFGALRGRERTTAMMARRAIAGDTALVAINADFFDLATGEVRNNEVIRGRWSRGTARSRGAEPRSQFAMTVTGEPLIGRLTLDAWLVAAGDSVRVTGLNVPAASPHDVIVYTPWHGERSAGRDSVAARTGRSTTALVLQPHSSGDTARYRVASDEPDGYGVAIPPRGAVVVFADSARQARQRLPLNGGEVRLHLGVDGQRTPIRTIVGGWPRIVTDGRSVAALADSAERTAASFSAARHPRSAVGIDRERRRLILAVVDGRRPWSVGMTLVELATVLIELGAHQALNLDGGGSTTLVVGNRIVNVPSDAAGERAVGNALLVFGR